MAKKQYIATFSNGKEITRISDREYSTAWGSFDKDGKLLQKGFSNKLNPAVTPHYLCHKTEVVKAIKI